MPDDIAWADEGHELLGSRVARLHGKKCVLGAITKWVDADEAEGDPALFKMQHDDGDEEDLEEEEVRAAVRLYAEQRDGAQADVSASPSYDVAAIEDERRNEERRCVELLVRWVGYATPRASLTGSRTSPDLSIHCARHR